MENLFLLKGVYSPWLSPSSTTWAMNMILAFVCGVGLFFLILPFLQGNPPSPPPPSPPLPLQIKTNVKKMTKMRWCKTRQKNEPVRVGRAVKKKVTETQDLILLLESMLEKLGGSCSFNQLIRGDAPGETLKSASATLHHPPREPVEDADTVSPLASLTHLTKALLPKASMLSWGLVTSTDSRGSQSSQRASQPIEPWIPEVHHSHQLHAGSSPLSHPPDPVACLPSLPDSQSDSVALSVEATPQGCSPVLATKDLGHSSCPISDPSWGQMGSRAQCLSSSSHGESPPESPSLNPSEASFWTDPTHVQREAEGPSFINPEVQILLEILISKRAELKAVTGKENKHSEDALHSLGTMFPSLVSEQNTSISQPFQNRHGSTKQRPSDQQLFDPKVFGDCLQQTYTQLFWGLPFLHSESLVATIRMSGSRLDFPSVLFNGGSTHVPGQVPANMSPQLFSPQPLPHHLTQPQTFTPTLTWSQPSPMVGIQTQAQLSSPSPPVLPCHSPTGIACGFSCPTTQKKSQWSISPAAQNLEYHLFKKYVESKRDLPTIVKTTQEVFNHPNANSWASPNQRSVVNYPGVFISPELQEQLEKHLQRRFAQQQGQMPCKVQFYLDLTESRDRLPVTRQANGKYGSSCSLGLTEESHQHVQCGTSRRPEILKVGNNSCKRLWRSLEGSTFKVLESISEAEPERGQMSSSRSDSGSASSVGPGKKHLEGILKVHASRTLGQSNEGTVPLGIFHGGLSTSHSLALHEKPDTAMETGNESPRNGLVTWKNTCQQFPFLHPGTQQALEAHVRRLLVRHRWGLPLKVLKTVGLLTLKKAPASSCSEPQFPSLTTMDSRASSINKVASFVEEIAQKSRDMAAKKAAPTVQYPMSITSLKALRGSPTDDNSRPSKAPPAARENSLPCQHHTYKLVNRTWHSDTVLGSRIGMPNPSSQPVIGRNEPQKSGGMGSKDLFHKLSIWEVNVTSQSSKTKDLKEMAKAKEKEEPSDCALSLRAREMANSQTNHQSLRNLESLETSKNSHPSRISISQNPGDSGLNTPQHSTTGVMIKDCSTGKLLQDCAPQEPLADIMASQASLSTSQSISSSNRSVFQESCCAYPSEEGSRPQIHKFQGPWTNSIFGTIDESESSRRPKAGQQEGRLIESRPPLTCMQSTPTQLREVNAVKKRQAPVTRSFGDKIRNLIAMILPNRSKAQAYSMQKVPIPSVPAQSLRSGMRRKFQHNQQVEAQQLMTSVGQILEEKMGIYHGQSPPKKNLHREETQAPVRRHASHHRSTSSKQRSMKEDMGSCHQANPKGHSHVFRNKEVRHSENRQIQQFREPGTSASPYQHGVQVVGASGHHVHCPRHCYLWRSMLSGQPHASHLCSWKPPQGHAVFLQK